MNAEHESMTRTYEVEAEKAGVHFLGMQQFTPDFSAPLFSFPKHVCNGTTFSLNVGESLPAAIERKKKEFQEAIQ